jgi:hypothetical protein
MECKQKKEMQTVMWRDTHQAIIMQFQVNKVVINYASGIWYDASFLGRSKEKLCIPLIILLLRQVKYD